jgi:uncharacterized phage protein (TIGR01671 family)
MREIKFRAWDESQKHMAYQGTPDLETLQSFIHHYGDQVLMQFTGLTDSTGRDIYEGDLIRYDGKNHWILQVEFKNAYVGGWVLTHPSTEKWVSLSARKTEQINVIGNVYENPDLLK